MNEDDVEKEEADPFGGFVCYNCGKELNMIDWNNTRCRDCDSKLIGFLSDKE